MKAWKVQAWPRQPHREEHRPRQRHSRRNQCCHAPADHLVRGVWCKAGVLLRCVAQAYKVAKVQRLYDELTVEMQQCCHAARQGCHAVHCPRSNPQSLEAQLGGSLTGAVASLLSIPRHTSRSDTGLFCAGESPPPAQALGPGVAAMGLSFYPGGQPCKMLWKSQSLACLG